MKKLVEGLIGPKVNNVRIVPVVTKIVVIFTLFIMTSNLATNFINLMLNRTEQIKLMKSLLVKDLKQIYTFANNQHEIFLFNGDLKGSTQAIEDYTVRDLPGSRSIGLGVRPDGSFLFQAARFPLSASVIDPAALQTIADNTARGVQEDSLTFLFNDDGYFGVYKYNPNWDVYLFRAEELEEFYRPSWLIFRDVSVLILALTLASAVVGIFLLRHALRYVRIITTAIMNMHQEQELGLIDMSRASTDDVTYLGISFNTLSNTISNLLRIFRKFVTKDVALKAYKDRFVRLEGAQMELAILFSDIRSFTFITETLGGDIIKLLNLHYDRAISSVRSHGGIIGSIIGDALLGVFGALGAQENKSRAAIQAGYEIQRAAETLRTEMQQRFEDMREHDQEPSEDEQRLYRAVLLEIGVGIDAGTAFYGNVGSRDRMTNTVIGDRVNSASRLEGLTRIYAAPVICSEYVREDVEADGGNGIVFAEIDRVQVMGKTEGTRIYWPILSADYTEELAKQLELFGRGLELYYRGRWADARKWFGRCELPLAKEFRERTAARCPRGWNGVWEMMTK